MNTVTLGDVAAAAGVSKGTASRAMTGSGRVSQETIRHVRAVADRLGYQPDAIGRALRRGTSSTIGMVVPDIENPFFASLIRGVESTLFEHGYEMLVADSQADVTVEAHRLRTLLARRVDGIVIIPARIDESAEAVSRTASAVPVVQIERSGGAGVADYVGVDNARGMDLVASHLSQLGVSSAVYIGGNDVTSAGRERAEAFARSAEESGIEIVSTFRRRFDVPTGVDGVKRLGALPGAVVCGDDLNALGALGELQRNGALIPSSIKVTGFNGTTLAATIEPALTTVEQPVAELSAAAVSQLMVRAEARSNERALIEQRFEPKLRVGGTTVGRRDL